MAKSERRTPVKRTGWEHAGGGCLIGSKEKLCCDDDYQNVRTGEIVTFATTMGRHLQMPHFVKSLAEIEALTGVERRANSKEHAG